MSVDFLYRDLPRVGRRVHRLGLATNYLSDDSGIRAALDRGLDYLLVPQSDAGRVGRVLRGVDKSKLTIATIASVGWFGAGVRRSCETILRKLEVDHIDVFELGWVGVGARWADGTREALSRLREQGKIGAAGISIHDRPRAAEIAREGLLDLFMLRYNAAHPGAEREIFPHLPPRDDPDRPTVVAYTATRWRKLLQRPKGWEGAVPTAGDCYRFCLSSPDVDVVLTGPKTVAQLDENLAAVAQGPLDEQQDAWMRDFGKVVHDTASRIPGL